MAELTPDELGAYQDLVNDGLEVWPHDPDHAELRACGACGGWHAPDENCDLDDIIAIVDSHPEEGWAIFECWGSDNGPWQIQKFDVPEDHAHCATCGKTVVETDELPPLSRQSAWQHADGTGGGATELTRSQWCETPQGYVKVAAVHARAWETDSDVWDWLYFRLIHGDQLAGRVLVWVSNANPLERAAIVRNCITGPR